jgi:MFS family permease
MNSSDVFLLLRAKEISGSDSSVLMVYIFYNLVYAAFAYPLGKLSDKMGMKKMIIIGLLLFAGVYAGMAFANAFVIIAGLYFLYGIYMAATEGIIKALISNIVPPTETASGIGFYTGWNSICALIASSLTGWIWYAVSPEAAFLLSAGGTAVAAVYIATRKL